MRLSDTMMDCMWYPGIRKPAHWPLDRQPHVLYVSNGMVDSGWSRQMVVALSVSQVIQLFRTPSNMERKQQKTKQQHKWFIHERFHHYRKTRKKANEINDNICLLFPVCVHHNSIIRCTQQNIEKDPNRKRATSAVCAECWVLAVGWNR